MLPGGHYALVSVSARGQQADDDHIGVISIDDGRVEDLGIVGTNAQYSSVRFAEAWVFDTTDGTTHKLFNEEASVGDPELSPDGRLVTYTLRSGTRRGLFVRPFASAGVPSVVVDGYVDFHRWSDDGRSIYFVRANRTIEVVDVNAAGEPLGPPRIVVPTSTLEAMRDDYLKARFTLIPGTRELYVSLNNQRAHGLVVLQNFEAFAVRVR